MTGGGRWGKSFCKRAQHKQRHNTEWLGVFRELKVVWDFENKI